MLGREWMMLIKAIQCLFGGRYQYRVTSQSIPNGTCLGTFLRRSTDLFSDIATERQILMSKTD